jgi:hypothetical protein
MRFKPLLLLLLASSFARPQGGIVPAKEILEYKVEWRLITAGRARLEFNAGETPSAPSRVNMHVESVGLVSKLFKVEDDYAARMNQNFCAESVEISSLEGSRQRETRIRYDSEAKKANYLERDRLKNSVILSQEIDVPPCVHDVVGGLYFIRTLNLEPGQSTQVPVSDGKKSVMARIEAQQREEVRTPAGTFRTVRYEAYLFNNVLFRRQAHLYFWLTDDRRKLPVQIRVRMQFTIGTITLQLDKHE